MGMSSSQARLLTLTARMHDIEYRAQRLEAQKLQMANESRRAYESYLEAIDATKIQYKGINGDGSITFRDATLRTLENGAIPNYEGEASYKPYLLKNGMTDEIYVTPEFAAAFGIEDTSELPPLGTLEEWLNEYQGLTRGGNFVENVVTPPVDLRTVYTNEISGSVSRPTMSKHVYSGIPEYGNVHTNQYYGWSMSAKNGQLPSDWKNAGGYKYYNPWLDSNDSYNTWNSAAYKSAKEHKGIVENPPSARKPYWKEGDNTYYANYDFSLSNQYTNYSFSLLKGLVTGYVERDFSFSGYIEAGTDAYHIDNGSNYTCVYATSDATSEEKNSIKALATFMYNAVQVMTDVLDQYGTRYNDDPNAKLVVDDFYNNVMSKIGGNNYEGKSQDLYNNLLEFCMNHDFARPYLNGAGTDFETKKNNYVSVPDVGGCYWQSARASFFNNADAKTYGDVDYSKSDIKILIKLGLVDAGMTEEEANTKVNSFTDWQLYSIIGNYNATDWATCMNGIVTGDYDAGTKPTNFTLVTNDTNKITLSETEVVSDLNSADTISFDYTQNSYREQVLYDICQTDNEINKNGYRSSVSGLTDVELASLIYLKFNDPSAYNNIIQRIIDANGDPDQISAIKADLQSCAGKTITWGTNTVQFTQTSDTEGKGKVEIPTLSGIASNIYVAMKQNGIDSLTEGEILNYLQTNYGEETFENSLILAYINEKACAGDISVLTKISNGYVIDTVNDLQVDYVTRYPRDNYDITRSLSGRASDDWVHDDIYEQAVREYNQQKALRESKFKIIRDEELLNSTEFLSNWLTLNEGYLLEFDPETFGMVDTNVAVTTHLQEVSDERNLKKAEAQYEADMKRIDMKDRRYDTQLAALDTERNAIKLEMETVKTVAKDNVDRTFRLFS